ncbi:MAG: hypothetical protein A2289_24070 [Deltaproteobacteria bacterium RIFOXYA12_FULL_58_15]|nr:MAG: hypothetical protein A2289_24070 [Deltaproteobacteria bacterium RIFOXYA12_FULL_58_15]OGR08598.1 MAG: hypothetical protein A2341_14140 [Deltaproteobacteria bacterium RIFOXYB12_FULL_58_9]
MTTSVTIDPERLMRRIRAAGDELAQRWGEAIAHAAFECLIRLNEIDFSAIERAVSEKSPSELWAETEERVAAMWLQLEDLRQLMQPLVEAFEKQHDSETPGAFGPLSDDAIAINLSCDDSTNQVEPPGVALEGLVKRIAETAWAMAFVLAGEVDGFRKRLGHVLRLTDGWELVGFLQDHLGHVRSAVGAVLGGVYSSLPAASGEVDDGEDNVELMTSRELRARLFELRDGILVVERRLHALPPGRWNEVLGEAHRLVEGFVFGPGFTWMRATDKRTFLMQRNTLAEILELYSPLRAEPARHNIQNLARFLEALEVINQRECLVVHDRAALNLVVASMEMAADGGAMAPKHISVALAALAEAQGRDRTLDLLLGQTMSPGNDVPVQDILARAREIRAHLGG